MSQLSRRSILTLAAGSAALPLTKLAWATPNADPDPQSDGPFTLPPLPYAPDALEKAIDAQTMSLHHDKHHGAYVANLNAAIKQAPEDIQNKPLDEILSDLSQVPEAIRTTIRNNGGGHANHSIFWKLMSPTGGGAPTGRIKEIIDSTFGGFDAFVTTFNDAGLKQFGSGWAWLVLGADGKYAIISRPNQDSPVMDGHYPILGNDVWEHAYYLRYQNRRADYLKAWWNVVNWDEVNRRISEGPR